ncbi:type IV secretion system protein [Ferrovum sp.]|uniref:type IV secretion system protein n=1 Tax=Ferrovum sp. TaxID=2609467 RepID=UPI0026194B65|nr:type IV secretion system protein [Ferrovum sp.]
MNKNRTLWLLGVALLGVCTPALAAGQADLGLVIQQYQTASAQFGTTIAQAAKWLVVTLATIDLSLLVIGKLLRTEGPQEILVAVIMRALWYGFLVFLMNVNIMTDVVQGFWKLGANASGISIFNPSDVFWQGIDLVNKMTTAFANNATIAGVPMPAGLAAAANPLVAFMLGMVIILIVLAFLILTAQYSVILVQMYFYLACYPLIVAFGGIKHGRDMTMKAISGAIVIGVRFLAIYFVLYAAQMMATTMGQQLAAFSITDMSPMWAVFGMSGLLAFLALKVPQMASDLLGGTASLSGGDMIGSAAIAAGGVAAVAGGAATLAGGAANGVANAVRAGASAITQARTAGATGVMETAAGAAGAIGGAVGEAARDTIKGLGTAPSGSLAARIDAKTAAMREANAASTVSAPTVPGSQPSAPAAPAAAPAPARVTPPAPAGMASSGDSTSAPAAVVDAPANASRATPPAPEVAPSAASYQSPPAPSAPTNGSAAGAPGSLPSSPAAPSATQRSAAEALSSKLTNELKQADRVQATPVSINSQSEE